MFDPISNKFHHPIPETRIAPQQLTIKPQPVQTTKPQQIQQQEPITDATGIERAMQNGHTHVIGNTIYIGGSNSQKDWYDDVTKIPTIWKAIPAIQHYKALMFGMTSLPYVKDYAKEIDNRLPFSHMGDLTKSEKVYRSRKCFKGKSKYNACRMI